MSELKPILERMNEAVQENLETIRRATDSGELQISDRSHSGGYVDLQHLLDYLVKHDMIELYGEEKPDE